MLWGVGTGVASSWDWKLPPPKARCEDCGLVYASEAWADLIIPDEAWETIWPGSNGSGLLCVGCIIARCARHDLTDLPFAFKSGPLRCSADDPAGYFFDPYSLTWRTGRGGWTPTTLSTLSEDEARVVDERIWGDRGVDMDIFSKWVPRPARVEDGSSFLAATRSPGGWVVTAVVVRVYEGPSVVVWVNGEPGYLCWSEVEYVVPLNEIIAGLPDVVS